ncbi:SMI1/KNR4 family protein [Streptomyces sp. NPDC048518]|uniref:SMI1/KNR4 family protein n=1 Tax=Streptomyces sp. NPDC048518 TaxID=3155029 RepID=UPI0033D386FD
MARFDEVKAAFWGGGDYGVQLPLNEEMVHEAEREIGVTLPPALLDLLRIQNGGSVAADWNAFPTRQPTSWSDDHVPLPDLMGIGRRERLSSLLDTPYLVEEWELPTPIVLLSGDGHCWIALDFRACGRNGEPSVTWFDTDLNTDITLTVDFRSFIEGLTLGSNFTDGPGSGPTPV